MAGSSPRRGVPRGSRFEVVARHAKRSAGGACSGPYSSHPPWQLPCYLPPRRPRLRPKPVGSPQRTRFTRVGIEVVTGPRDSTGNGTPSRCGLNPGLCGLSIGRALIHLGCQPMSGRANGTCPGIDVAMELPRLALPPGRSHACALGAPTLMPIGAGPQTRGRDRPPIDRQDPPLCLLTVWLGPCPCDHMHKATIVCDSRGWHAPAGAGECHGSGPCPSICLPTTALASMLGVRHRSPAPARVSLHQ